MKKYAVQSSFSILLASGILPCFAEDGQHYLSIVPRSGSLLKPIAKPSSLPSAARTAGKKTTVLPKQPLSGQNANIQTETSGTEALPETTTETAIPHSFYSAALEQAVRQYKAAPAPPAYSQMLDALKSTLSGAGNLRLSPAIIVRDNPYLADFKPKVIDTNGIRLWNFPKAPERSRVLLQWYDIHQQVIGAGRRKRVVTSTSMRFQELAFVLPMNVKDAGLVSAKENGRHLLLSGDGEDGSLLVQAYKLAENGWQSSPEYLFQIPAFLSTNVSGRISFRGADLIYNVGKMIQTTDSNGSKRFLPEAESATYKFWLKSTDAGYVVAAAVPDEEAFSGVFQFMQAVQQSRTDLEKTLLLDSRLSSLPKYLGLQGKPLDSSVRVVEMSVPPARGQRFRLINLGKDDLIFDVGKVKGQWQVKALFIAPPDPFLIETAKYFPPYSSFVQKVEQKNDAADKKEVRADGSAPTGAAAANAMNSASKKR